MAVTADQLREGVQRAEANTDNNEVERRVAASRSYYAAFHRCRPIAQAQVIFDDVRGSHAQVIEALTRSRDKKIKGIGWRLEQCREKRVKADYVLAEGFTSGDAKMVSEQCEKIWATAEGIEGTQAR